MSAETPEGRLEELGIALPEPPAPVASYVPWTRSGALVQISGQIPVAAGVLQYAGRVGSELEVAEAVEAARLCAVNLLAQLRAACDGDLGRVLRCLRLGVFVACGPDFRDHPQVANGASELLVAVFGEAGRHARAAVGASSLPLGAAVEVEGTFEIS